MDQCSCVACWSRAIQQVFFFNIWFRVCPFDGRLVVERFFSCVCCFPHFNNEISRSNECVSWAIAAVNHEVFFFSFLSFSVWILLNRWPLIKRPPIRSHSGRILLPSSQSQSIFDHFISSKYSPTLFVWFFFVLCFYYILGWNIE